jgi:hypothetical protein
LISGTRQTVHLLQVKECLRLAAQGKQYAAGKGSSGSEATGELGKAGQRQGEGTAAERGQRQEQQLHEDSEVLREQQAADAEDGAAHGGGAGKAGTAIDVGGGGDGIGQAGSDALVDEVLLNADEGLAAGGGGGKRGVVTKRIGEGGGSERGAVGVARLALFGVLLWAGSLLLACFLLPWARKSMRRKGHHGGGHRPKGRDD